MKCRTVWISDTHIGTRACKSEFLIDFLKTVEADKYYLVGDIVDGWSLKSHWYWSEDHNKIIRRLLKIAQQKEVIYIPGNHDEAIRSFCPTNFGNIKVKTNDVHVTKDGRRFIVLHGDIFDSFVCDLKHIRFIGDVAYDFLIGVNNIHHECLKFFGLKYWSLADSIKRRARSAVKIVERYEKAATNYARLKMFDGIICGHIHCPDIKDYGDVSYVNTGDWVENCTAIVEHEDGLLELIKWE